MPEIVDCQWLKDHLNDPKVRVLDVTHTMKPKRDWKTFEPVFADFVYHMVSNVESGYVMSHIPNAIHFNLEAAYYPSAFIKSDLYIPDLFEHYIKVLGINEDDEIIVYSRGPAAGMLFAARAWWTFKLYGHSNVKVLLGGFDQWKFLGYPTDGSHPTPPFGNWRAKPIDKNLLITFEELNGKNKKAKAKSIFKDCSKVNYFDARPIEQYNGSIPLGVPAAGANLSHLKGSKNLPLSKIIDSCGLKSKQEIETALEEADFDPNLPIITACNGGIQACLLSLALKVAGYSSKVYNGSMMEIGSRAPHLLIDESLIPQKPDEDEKTPQQADEEEKTPQQAEEDEKTPQQAEEDEKTPQQAEEVKISPQQPDDEKMEHQE